MDKETKRALRLSKKRHTRAFMKSLDASVHDIQLRYAFASAVCFLISVWCLFPMIDTRVSGDVIALGVLALGATAGFVAASEMAKTHARTKLRTARKNYFGLRSEVTA